MSCNPEQTRTFVQLFLRAEPRIYAYIRVQIPHRPDAEDVLQETTTVLWQKFEQFQPGTDFLAWAYRVARNKVRHYYRGKQRHPWHFAPDVTELLAATSDQLSVELSDMQNALAQCLQRLRPADRELVRQCYGTGATIRSVAEELHRPVETVKSILKRSRRALFDCVQRTLEREDRS